MTTQNEQAPTKFRPSLDDDDTLCYRNDVLEEVAQVIEQFKIPFAADTVASFAALIREMKR